jgi:hypothetical protein
MTFGVTCERGPITVIGLGFRANNGRRSELRGARAKVQRGCYARAVHDPSRRDDRHIERAHQQTGQRQRTEHIVRRIGIGNPTVAAGFVALRHDRMHAGGRQHPPFVDARGRTEQNDPASRKAFTHSGDGRPK